MAGPDYRGIQECYWQFGFETGSTANAMMLSPANATASTTVPTLGFLGYSSFPQVSVNNNPVPIFSAGAYRLLNSYQGVKDFSIRASMTIGNWQFMQLAMRNASVAGSSTYKGLPVLCLGFGSLSDPYYGVDNVDFNWRARYALIKSLTFSYAVGRPITVTVEFVPLYIETTTYSAPSITESDMEDALVVAGGEVLGWDNLVWEPGGTDNSHWLTSVDVTFTNGIEPIGQRLNLGANNALSRVRRSLNPTSEAVSVSYGMAAELATALRDGSMTADLWGTVTLTADNTAAGGGSSMILTIDHNRLAAESTAGGQNGQLLTWSASTLSGLIAITGTGGTNNGSGFGTGTG